MLTKQDVKALYQSGSKYYDFTTLLYRVIGLRMNTYRSLAVRLLRLARGDSAVELGCGTGLNFPLLMEQIGPEGRLVGVDLTPGMLERARERAERSGWKNVELFQSDIARYDIPRGVNGVLATGVFGYVAEYDGIIKAASEALAPGGRLVILDGKQPRNLPAWLFRVVLRLGRPFGFTPEYFSVSPWKSVERYLAETSFEELYGGLLYLSAGTANNHARQASD